jgi:hypothetical protein
MPKQQNWLSSAEAQQTVRAVGGTPEIAVTVLSGGGRVRR